MNRGTVDPNMSCEQDSQGRGQVHNSSSKNTAANPNDEKIMHGPITTYNRYHDMKCVHVTASIPIAASKMMQR